MATTPNSPVTITPYGIPKPRKPHATLYQHLKAPSTRGNGNPQRCYVVYSARGDILDVIDEGYSGLPKRLRKLGQLPDINVSASEYRDFLKHGAQRPY